MDDVAGCRLIFRNAKDLYAFRNKFRKARFDHKRRNEIDKYDYIKEPKDTGYRGVHDIYEYHVRSEVGRNLTGLYVEIQYRTPVQHAWATAVELVGFITESQPKFKAGDKRYEHAMALASEILARAFEKTTGPFPEIADRELVRKFVVLDAELALMRTLRGLNAADKEVTEDRNSILIFRPSAQLEVQTFRDATEALSVLFELEKLHPEYDIVLVRADTSNEVREAFRNYFSDARDFIRYIDEGCTRLSGTKRLSSVVRKRRPAARPYFRRARW